MGNYNLSEDDILSKLSLIEKHLNGFSHVFYDVTPSFSPIDIISVQKEASRMMKFAGLNHHIPCITYTKTESGVGGNVELDNSDNVFIEINEKYKRDKGKTLAVMAHEICHKVLYINHLYFPNNVIENELLTDIATIYVGFGKLSLNGCYSELKYNHTEWRNGKMVDVTTTEKETVGYLSLQQFATAYNIVCSIYNIDVASKEKGLNEHALKALNTSFVCSYGKISFDDIKQKLRESQQTDADVMRNILIIESLLGDLKKEVVGHHMQYRDDFVAPFISQGSSSVTSKQIVATALYKKYGESINMKEMSDALYELINKLTNKRKIDESILLNVICPCCGYRKDNGLKEHKSIFIKCPNCGYTFVWNANNIDVEALNKKNDPITNSEGLVDKFKNLFKKKDKVYITFPKE